MLNFAVRHCCCFFADSLHWFTSFFMIFQHMTRSILFHLHTDDQNWNVWSLLSGISIEIHVWLPHEKIVSRIDSSGKTLTCTANVSPWFFFPETVFLRNLILQKITFLELWVFRDKMKSLTSYHNSKADSACGKVISFNCQLKKICVIRNKDPKTKATPSASPFPRLIFVPDPCTFLQAVQGDGEWGSQSTHNSSSALFCRCFFLTVSLF